MKSVNVKTISDDYDFVMLTTGGEDEKFLNSLLVPVIKFLPEDLRADKEHVWVFFDDEETDSSKCLIELIYDGIVYRRINPFTERKITSLFEDKPLESDDHEISLLWKLFPKVRFEFTWAAVIDEQNKAKDDQLHFLHQANMQLDLEKLKMEHYKALYDSMALPADYLT